MIEKSDINIEVRSYSEKTVKLAGKTTTLSELSSDDVSTLRDDIFYIIKNAQPEVQDIVATNANRILDMVRAVNTESKAGYSGMAGKGKGLVLNMTSPEDVKRGGAAIDTWETEYSSTGGKSFLWGSGNKLALGEQEGGIILGLTDRVKVPKVSKVQVWKNNKKVVENIEQFKDRTYKDGGELPVYELRKKVYLLPEQKFYMDCYVYTTGTDRLKPIMFHAKMARDVKSFEPSPLGA